MKLTGHQIQQIRDALLDAYPSRDLLRMMVRIELEEDLEAVAGGENQRVVIFNLVNWADKSGRVDALITGAYKQMLGNPALQQLVTEWRALAPPGVEPSVTSPAAALSRRSGPASIDLFLSYSRKDSDAMHQALEALRDTGLSVWIDEGEGLEPGTQDWQDAIMEALGQAQAMVVLLSPNAKASRWVKNEISYAQNLGKRVFPILIGGDATTAVPLGIVNTQWVDGRENIGRAVRQELRPALFRYLGREAAHYAKPDAEPHPREEPTTPDDVQPVKLVTKRSSKEQPSSSLPAETLPTQAQASSDKSLSKPDIAKRDPAVTAGIEVTAPPTSSKTQPEKGNIGEGSQQRWAYYVVALVAVIGSIASIFWSFSVINRTLAPTTTPLVTKTNPKDGAEYVFVPAGQFTMGSGEGDSMASDDEKPQTTVNMDGFWIMRTEVTYGQYKRCVDDNQACKEPGNERWNDPAYVDHPVTDVDWYQANDYARWVDGGLPTEAEWEKACRGTDGRIYPWGNSSPTADLANFNSNVNDTTPVGKYSPQGDSPYGLVDIAGNVWEWTSNQYRDYPYNASDGRENLEGGAHPSVRGGSWLGDDLNVRCADRVAVEPGGWNGSIGFRLVSPGF